MRPGPSKKLWWSQKVSNKSKKKKKKIKGAAVGIIITTRMGSMSNGYDNSAEQQHPLKVITAGRLVTFELQIFESELFGVEGNN